MATLEDFRALQLEVDLQKTIVSLNDPEIAWLLQLASARNATRSLETGLGNGHSAAALLLAGVAEHFSIEISTRNLHVSVANAMKAKKGHQRFRLLMGASDIRLAQLVDTGEKFDIILVDGGHAYEDAFIDMHYARSLVDEGGIMVIDDTHVTSVANAMTWHERQLKHIWHRIIPPPHLATQTGFAMAAFQRSGRYDIPARTS